MALVFNLVDGDQLSIDGPAKVLVGEKSGRRTKLVVLPEEGTKVTRERPVDSQATFAGRMGLTRGVSDQE